MGQVVISKRHKYFGFFDIDLPKVTSASLVIEDIDEQPGSPELENNLFHLFNMLLANNYYLLLTSKKDPKFWTVNLPDLRSRILGMRNARLLPPDDKLFLALIANFLPTDKFTRSQKYCNTSHATVREVLAQPVDW